MKENQFYLLLILLLLLVSQKTTMLLLELHLWHPLRLSDAQVTGAVGTVTFLNLKRKIVQHKYIISHQYTDLVRENLSPKPADLDS